MKPTQAIKSKLHSKINHSHQQRLAYIYVRQSTLQQVRHNQESQHCQYRLKQRAFELGWPENRIRIIDSDLGFSGSNADNRVGFQKLVAEVSLGRVGIIFGYDVSRLARNNSDWYNLLDLAAIFGTLIADSDGIYDPQSYNDRLLLGLKGTMSEAELHTMRQRLEAGRMAQVKRGTYRQTLPTGLLRLADHTVVKDPDDQVRQAIELVLSQFEILGSATQVMFYLHQNQIQLPRRQTFGDQIGQLLWKDAAYSAVIRIIKNPAYAGAFAYGRIQKNPIRQQSRSPKPMSEWIHLQHDVYPAYISWNQYLTNQKRLQKNSLQFPKNSQSAPGIARDGSALLQGIIVCGDCTHRMHVNYKNKSRYVCRGLKHLSKESRSCSSVATDTIDKVIIQAFFEAIQPARLNALDAILTAQKQEREELERQRQNQLKRAQYEVSLARRQYDAVDPQNRLVAAELERRWEEKLQHLQQIEADYHHFQKELLPDTIPDSLRKQFREVSQKLPELWTHLTNSQKKELLRTLIKQVIVRRLTLDNVELRLIWISGFYTQLTIKTSPLRNRDLSEYGQISERIHQLWKEGYTDSKIAEKLTQEGFHSSRSDYVSRSMVMDIRKSQKWSGRLPQDGYLTVAELATLLKVAPNTVYHYIYKQIIPSKYVVCRGKYYLIRHDEQLIKQLQDHPPKNGRPRLRIN